MTPGLPRLRRLSHFAGEILGMHLRTSRLLFSTREGSVVDGGTAHESTARTRTIFGFWQPLR